MVGHLAAAGGEDDHLARQIGVGLVAGVIDPAPQWLIERGLPALLKTRFSPEHASPLFRSQTQGCDQRINDGDA